jgi:hypothetical protein
MIIKMNEINLGTSKKKLFIPLVCVILLAIGSGIYFVSSKKSEEIGQLPKTSQAIPREKVIDFNQVNQDQNLQVLIKERKKNFGLDKGVDIIVSADESFKIGESIIPMREILEKIRIKQGDLIEEGLTDNPFGKSLETQDLSEKSNHSFGIYVVKSNDNFWDIHFRFLQDYFEKKNIQLSPMADKPDSQGFSSDIGKILKFSEKIVYIYNIRDRKLDVNLNLIHPENEIVVFHMAEILSLLDQIDLVNVDMIRFDGENLWISPKS